MRRGSLPMFSWRPAVSVQQLSLARFVSDVRLQTDFGPGYPPGQPQEQKKPLYVVEPSGKKGTFQRFLRMAREEAPLIAASVACVAVYSTATLAIPYGFGELIDHASRGEMPWNTSWRLLAWFAVAGAGNFARLALIGIAGERMVTRLRERLFRALTKQETAFFDSPENRTGALGQRLSMDTNVVGSSLTEGLSQGVKNILQMFGAMGVMLYFSPALTSCICVVLPPVAIIAGQYGRLIRQLQVKKQDAIANMGTVAEERLSNIRLVKAYAREAEESTYFASKVKRIFGISQTMVLWNSTYVTFLHVSGYMVLYSVIWCGAMLVSANQLTAGTLFSFMLYTIYCGVGITGVTNLVTELNKGYGASIRFFDIIDKAEQITQMENQRKGLKLPMSEGRFKFEKVGFAYPTRPDITIFRDLDLALAPGKCTVIVGSSGSGKSSLAMMLLKLYDPTNGRVTLDDHDLAALDLKWLRSQIGYVPQEPVLFGGTIAENIAYGVHNRQWGEKLDTWTRDAVVAAAKKANAHDFICALPDQYETWVGEGGRTVSGGQKQRIAIARALVKKPQLLILDEATSALDAESEAVVQAAIEKLVQDARIEKNRSVLMFAHRLSMIRQADCIVILKDGGVMQMGTYEEVLQNPYFRHLVGVTQDGRVDTAKNNLSDYLRRPAHHLDADLPPPEQEAKKVVPMEEDETQRIGQ
jgi:ATP-binding cassette subfamily B (MDR/TAP) protein 10